MHRCLRRHLDGFQSRSVLWMQFCEINRDVLWFLTVHRWRKWRLQNHSKQRFKYEGFMKSVMNILVKILLASVLKIWTGFSVEKGKVTVQHFAATRPQHLIKTLMCIWMKTMIEAILQFCFCQLVCLNKLIRHRVYDWTNCLDMCLMLNRWT